MVEGMVVEGRSGAEFEFVFEGKFLVIFVVLELVEVSFEGLVFFFEFLELEF